MTEPFSIARVAIGTIATCVIAFYAGTSHAQARDDDSKGLKGSLGCYYQSSDILWDYELEKKNLMNALKKYEARLRRGEETYRPAAEQQIQVMVVACETSDEPMVWWRPETPTIVIVPEGYLKQPKYQ